MSRPGDWYPLAGHDPVPGDPDQVRAAAERYADIARRIRGAAENLLAASATADGSSEAVAAFRDKALDVREGILKAESRYDGLSKALYAYTPHLASAQADSRRALEMARAAQSEAQAARNNESYLRDQVEQTPDPIERAELARRLSAQEQRAGDADTVLEKARIQLAAAIDERDRAADVAIQQISDVEAVSPVRDQWHDEMRDRAGKVADTLAMWAEALDEVLSKYEWVLVALQVAVMVAALLIPGAMAIALIVRVVAAVVKTLTVVRAVVTYAQIASTTVQVASGRKPVSALAGMIAGIALGVAFKRLGRRAFDGAAHHLTTSENMRFVRQGLKRPGERAERWARDALSDRSHVVLEELYGRSTEYGRRAIAEGVLKMVVIDEVKDRIAPVVSNSVQSGFDFVIENPPLRSNETPSRVPQQQTTPASSGGGGW